MDEISLPLSIAVCCIRQIAGAGLWQRKGRGRISDSAAWQMGYVWEMANFGTNYMMISTVPQYSDLFGGDWDIYWLTQDGVRADVETGSLNLFMYYYQGSRQRAGSGMEETTEVIAVQESQGYIDFPTGDFLRELDNSKYALDNNGSLVTDFIYDESA